MRPWAPVALLLVGCPEPVPEAARSTPMEHSGTIVKFGEKEDFFWVLRDGKLARCHYDMGKSAPVCLIPPFIKVPAELWTPYLGIPTKSRKTTDKPVHEGPAPE